MEFGGAVSGTSSVKVVESSSKRVMRSSDTMLRILGLLVTLVAAVLVGVDKETEVLSVTVINTLPPLHVPVTAKWQYLSALVYFMVSNTIACLYAAASLAYSITFLARKFENNTAILVRTILDLIILGLLSSATGAGTAVGVLGLEGNSHVLWKKVCNLFSGFCREFAAALVLSLLGSLVFLLLVVVAVFNLHKRSSIK
ncbi:hypothetical protein LWI28_026638 [Acer negundo]|uniref:CASP-like protein n=1 Tax=Acer negundo TaxID=4023 RepID=A0AAD5J1V9_ACENE|nr:hypothetical protein LWI28_026638 [Acer negundo]KAK4849308.1 hypothetical protein QYF36_023390 [Acer negundo]